MVGTMIEEVKIHNSTIQKSLTSILEMLKAMDKEIRSISNHLGDIKKGFSNRTNIQTSLKVTKLILAL